MITGKTASKTHKCFIKKYYQYDTPPVTHIFPAYRIMRNLGCPAEYRAFYSFIHLILILTLNIAVYLSILVYSKMFEFSVPLYSFKNYGILSRLFNCVYRYSVDFLWAIFIVELLTVKYHNKQ